MEENREEIEELLTLMADAPDSQMDKSITERLRNLKGKPIPEIKTEVMHIMDDCVYGALASDFGMHALIILHEVFLDGKDEDFNDENCPWRKNMK